MIVCCFQNVYYINLLVLPPLKNYLASSLMVRRLAILHILNKLYVSSIKQEHRTQKWYYLKRGKVKFYDNLNSQHEILQVLQGYTSCTTPKESESEIFDLSQAIADCGKERSLRSSTDPVVSHSTASSNCFDQLLQSSKDSHINLDLTISPYYH